MGGARQQAEQDFLKHFLPKLFHIINIIYLVVSFLTIMIVINYIKQLNV